MFLLFCTTICQRQIQLSNKNLKKTLCFLTQDIPKQYILYIYIKYKLQHPSLKQSNIESAEYAKL